METYGYLNIVKDRLDEIGQEIVKEMQQVIINNNAIASKKLLNSIGYNLTFEDGKFNMLIEYEDYGYFVDKGRRPSLKFPPMENIKQWMNLKGIPQQALWPIMVKIKKGGFYSKKTMTMYNADGTQRTFYSQPRGINFTSPFEKNLNLQKIMKEFEGLIAAEIPKDLLEGLGFDKNNLIK